jgi:hypothetical protein
MEPTLYERVLSFYFAEPLDGGMIGGRILVVLPGYIAREREQ